MIVPIAIGAAALYGWFRYDKAKKAKELQGLLTAPPPAPAPGFAPSPTLLKSVASAVQKQAAAQTGTGMSLTGSLGKIFGATARTGPASDPNAIPSSRIPSSAYSTGGGAPPPPAPAPAAGASGSIDFKLKL